MQGTVAEGTCLQVPKVKERNQENRKNVKTEERKTVGPRLERARCGVKTGILTTRLFYAAASSCSEILEAEKRENKTGERKTAGPRFERAYSDVETRLLTARLFYVLVPSCSEILEAGKREKKRPTQ